jgi:hypothetical protein
MGYLTLHEISTRKHDTFSIPKEVAYRKYNITPLLTAAKEA